MDNRVESRGVMNPALDPESDFHLIVRVNQLNTISNAIISLKIGLHKQTICEFFSGERFKKPKKSSFLITNNTIKIRYFGKFWLNYVNLVPFILLNPVHG